MLFHEVLESDLEDTFLAVDEFASEHMVNNILMKCVIDDSHGSLKTGSEENMINASGLGLLECERHMYCSIKNFTYQVPMVGERINIDGTMWTVERIVLNEGLLEIGLNRAY